jgi:hypothetical protein
MFSPACLLRCSRSCVPCCRCSLLPPIVFASLPASCSPRCRHSARGLPSCRVYPPAGFTLLPALVLTRYRRSYLPCCNVYPDAAARFNPAAVFILLPALDLTLLPYLPCHRRSCLLRCLRSCSSRCRRPCLPLLMCRYLFFFSQACPAAARVCSAAAVSVAAAVLCCRVCVLPHPMCFTSAGVRLANVCPVCALQEQLYSLLLLPPAFSLPPPMCAALPAATSLCPAAIVARFALQLLFYGCVTCRRCHS